MLDESLTYSRVMLNRSKSVPKMHFVRSTATHKNYALQKMSPAATAIKRSLSHCLAAKRMTVNEVADLEEVNVPFVGEVYNGKGYFWTAVVKVDGNNKCFILDTREAVSIVSDKEPWLEDQ